MLVPQADKTQDDNDAASNAMDSVEQAFLCPIWLNLACTSNQPKSIAMLSVWYFCFKRDVSLWLSYYISSHAQNESFVAVRTYACISSQRGGTLSPDNQFHLGELMQKWCLSGTLAYPLECSGTTFLFIICKGKTYNNKCRVFQDDFLSKYNQWYCIVSCRPALFIESFRTRRGCLFSTSISIRS
jgi:hypothetical protein